MAAPGGGVPLRGGNPWRHQPSNARNGFLGARSRLNAAGPVEFNSNLSIVLYPDPKLRARNIRINSFDDNLKKLVDEMLDVMYRRDGVGLSAPQVCVNARLMVFNPEGERGKGKEYVFVNPMIVKFGKEREADTLEGCLPSFGAQANVEVLFLRT
ncbi:peptide deformylase 1B, chloroplastic-like [Selaginella moellendorffii]|uniref:peptide deformylase 1B, chloroplastic-like n=1 Tax=Selaginella moellendorffii TaxID=88036 RepID=UPI000D1D0949|nr:peptide deformylase 1B, chloroplastic-like [Selaginella moellendorffii]|eukprot:XP_024538686.1 peptide deformylase 1B, chloroplastic-like [Selaginella moellendorffii]